jgi:hypothetical protein
MDDELHAHPSLSMTVTQQHSLVTVLPLVDNDNEPAAVPRQQE